MSGAYSSTGPVAACPIPSWAGRCEIFGAVESYADQLFSDLLDALDLDTAAVEATSSGGFYTFRGAAAAPERVTRIVEYSWLIEHAQQKARPSRRESVRSLA